MRKLDINFGGKLAKNLQIALSQLMKAPSIFLQLIVPMDGLSKVHVYARAVNLSEEHGRHHE